MVCHNVAGHFYLGKAFPALILSHRNCLTSQSAADRTALFLHPASTASSIPPPEAACHRFGCPLALVDSCAVHAARDTYAFDMSILILVHLNQMAIRRGGLRDVLAHLPLVTIRPSQAAALSVIRGSEEDGNEGRGLGSPPCGRDDYGGQQERSGIVTKKSYCTCRVCAVAFCKNKTANAVYCLLVKVFVPIFGEG